MQAASPIPSRQRHHRLLVWMHRALRVDDNTPLQQAIADADEVVPIIVLRDDRSGLEDLPRRRFINQAIAGCDAELRGRGSRLVPLLGIPEKEIPRALKRYNADGVYGPELTDPSSRARDRRVEAAVEQAGGSYLRFPDRRLRLEGEVLNQQGLPYRLFTPYQREWLRGAAEIRPPHAPIRSIRTPEPPPGEIPLARIPGSLPPPRRLPTRVGAAQLRGFLAGPLATYDVGRDFPGREGTSQLSPFLAHGVISPRLVFHSLQSHQRASRGKGSAGYRSFQSELIWREFYYDILHHFPAVVTDPFRAEFAALRWRNNRAEFSAWQEGRTGYPIVDAGMRQLAATGWMHNRTRMIVASFLTKHLRIDWRWGEEYFFRHLVDGDIASNNGGWQWSAGTGTDASPWFRIFNPALQSAKFDPEGTYIRRWIPELADLPTRRLHAPWEGDRIARYPSPLVDHTAARRDALAMYGGVR